MIKAKGEKEMSRAVQFILFFSVFFLVYLGMHAYVFWRLFDMFSIKVGTGFIIMVLAFALSMPVFSMLERYSYNMITRIFYTLSATWLGVLFLLFSAMLLYELVNLVLSRFYAVDQMIAGTVMLAVVGILSMIALINGAILTERHVEINIAGLDKEITAVQLSDLHIGSVRNSGWLEKVVDKTNKLNPDVVFITGDIIEGKGMFSDSVKEALKGIKAKSFFSTGNHERYADTARIVRLLEDVGIKVLRNESVEHQGLVVVGVDDASDGFEKPNDVMGNIRFNKSRPSVLMYHPPTGLAEAKKAGIDLQLSGHTHNGQLFPFNLIVNRFYRYTKGLHDISGMKLYVSSGTGTWGPPMRLGSRNEVTVLHLKPE